jgi:hypothetical protein
MRFPIPGIETPNGAMGSIHRRVYGFGAFKAGLI